MVASCFAELNERDAEQSHQRDREAKSRESVVKVERGWLAREDRKWIENDMGETKKQKTNVRDKQEGRDRRGARGPAG